MGDGDMRPILCYFCVILELLNIKSYVNKQLNKK